MRDGAAHLIDMISRDRVVTAQTIKRDVQTVSRHTPASHLRIAESTLVLRAMAQIERISEIG